MQKLFKVFIAGKYPQGEISENDLKEIARNYSPAYHEAPLTLDHKREGSALGWIDKVIAKGKELWVSFSKVSDEAMELTKEGRYKRPSIEIADYEGVGKYLRAVSLVNFPQVKGLPEMQFQTTDKEAVIYFSEDLFLNFHGEKNKETNLKKNSKQKNKTVSETVLKFAESLGLDAEADIEKIVQSAGAKISSLESDVAVLGDAVKRYEEEIEKISEKRAETLVNNAVASGKILPAQKDFLMTFAENDFDACKSYLDMLPSNPLFEKNKISAGSLNLKDPKYFNERGTRITYAQILRNPKLIEKNKFSEAELEQMRAEHFK
jgi:phage I-like protein